MDDPRSMIRAGIEALFVLEDQVVELRALGVPRGNRLQVAAGWFNDREKLLGAALQLEQRNATGVYVTLNSVDPTLLAKANNRVLPSPARTTRDADVLERLWLPIDFDSVRPSGTSATDEEVAQAKDRALRTEEWLRAELGCSPDIWAFSGNGWHLLYRVELPNTADTTEMIKKALDRTSKKFSDELVNVDRTVSNAGRIWKLYGTIARKGDEIQAQGRIHRRSRICKEGFADD